MDLLLVDNSTLIRDKLAAWISRIENVQVKTAGQVAEAVKAYKKVNPEVVILDFHLPDGSGFEVLDEIRKKDPSTVVIMYTDFGTPQHRKKSLEAGADFFFDKSNGFHAVYDLVQWLVRNEGKEYRTKGESPENSQREEGVE